MQSLFKIIFNDHISLKHGKIKPRQHILAILLVTSLGNIGLEVTSKQNCRCQLYKVGRHLPDR